MLESKCFKDVALDESSGILCLEHADGKSGRLPSRQMEVVIQMSTETFCGSAPALGNRVEVGKVLILSSLRL